MSSPSSLFKKYVMALTGLGLVIFLIGHLAGNLYLFGGQEPFDGYAAGLEALGALLILAEAGLLLVFLVHIGLAFRLTEENRKARGQTGYDESDNQSRASSRLMLITGLLIFVFVVVHVWMFKFGERPPLENGTVKVVKISGSGQASVSVSAASRGEEGSLYLLVKQSFKKPWIVAFYVVMMLALGLHLSHAASSALQSLGLLQPRWLPGAQKFGRIFGWALAAGFASLPVFMFLFA